MTTPSEVTDALRRVTSQLPGGGEVREGQAAMAEAVVAAIRKERHLVVQAGTGTGKSLGYLVPALLSGKRIVVSTATIALQDQLAAKDLPFLAKTLGVPFTFALLKGRSNYFCLQKAAELLQSSNQGELSLPDDDSGPRRASRADIVHEVTELATWSATTQTGDRAELTKEPSVAAWSAVSVSAGECPGASKCPIGEACFAEKARQRASTADVVVVNTHLYAQHVRTGGYVLPDHDIVIFDEAHEVEDIVADGLGIEISSGRFSFLAGRARQVVADFDAAVNLVDVGTRLDRALEGHSGQRLVVGPAAVPEIRDVLVLAMDRVNRAMSTLRGVPDTDTGGVAARKQRAIQAATGLLDELTLASELGAVREVPAMAAVTDDGGDSTARPKFDLGERVAWVEPETPTRGPVLRIAPIEIGPSLAAAVFENTVSILTSATVPANLTARLGLPTDDTDTLDVGSPFDYAHQALLYCATHLPDPRNDKYEAAMHRELARLLEAAGGRTLALFTSWRGMRAAAEAMTAKQFPFRILTQSELPKPLLTKVFAEDETSCLFATMGYWQGIDVPGRALSMVVIDKLPFARPDEPLLVARREKLGDAAFRLLDLPRAAMLLAQGCGRLIRSSSDRGVVAVLDPRLNSAKSYRHELLQALPPMRRTRHIGDVEAFLAEITGT